MPGVSIALIRDARIAWTGHFGVRNRTTGVPVDDATVFSAQSMSKPVFAYRVMKLCEQGVLDLDAPLTRYTRDLFVKGDPRLHEQGGLPLIWTDLLEPLVDGVVFAWWSVPR